MTGIPPLAGPLIGPQQLSVTTTDSSGPATPFEVLLETAASLSPQKPSLRTFAFIELGMFGRHAALALPGEGAGQAIPPSNDAAASSAAAAPVQKETAPSPYTKASIEAINPDKPPQPSPTMGARHSPDLDRANPAHEPNIAEKVRTDLKVTPEVWKITTNQQTSARPLPTIQPISPPSSRVADTVPAGAAEAAASGGTPPVESEFTAESTTSVTPQIVAPDDVHAASAISSEAPQEAERSAPPPRLPLRESDHASGVVLTVAPGEDLVVVARGAGSSPEEAAGIRRAIEGVAAEFGLDVSELHLNGAPVPASSPLSAGGKHGSRTR